MNALKEQLRIVGFRVCTIAFAETMSQYLEEKGVEFAGTLGWGDAFKTGWYKVKLKPPIPTRLYHEVVLPGMKYISEQHHAELKNRGRLKFVFKMRRV